MPPADLRWVLEHRRDFFEVFLPWLPPRHPNGPGCPNLNRALAFETQAGRAAKHIIASRRTLAVPPVEFNDPRVAGDFLWRMARFRKSCFSLGADHPIAHADRLMPALAFAASRCGNRPPEAWIADSAHAAARHLAGCAAQFFERAAHEELAASRLRLAGKIVARIAKLGPIKRRELVRGFARQSAGLFNPVLDTLVALGVIRRDGLLLDLGPVRAARMAREDFVPPPASLPFEPPNPYGYSHHHASQQTAGGAPAVCGAVRANGSCRRHSRPVPGRAAAGRSLRSAGRPAWVRAERRPPRRGFPPLHPQP